MPPPPEIARRFRDAVGRWGQGATLEMLAPSLLPSSAQLETAAGRTQELGTVGEVLVRGYQVMAGYFELPAATKAAIDADGWLHTSDLGSMDTEGNLRIEGRVREMIIRGGENIFSREIEDVIASHPAVAAVAVGLSRAADGRCPEPHFVCAPK
jgi:fatty-acyl-CoA synthase